MEYDPTSGYLHDILDQPAALENTLRQLASARLSLEWLDLKGLVFEPPATILTGMGSSYHALHPLYYRLARAGFPVSMIETGELVHHAPGLLAQGRLLAAVSQSGRSAEIVRLVNLLAQDRFGGLDFVSVTNTPGSPLALDRNCVLTAAGEEHTVSCKTYLASLLALDWLGDRLVNRSASGALRGAAVLPAAVQGYLSRWKEHTARLEVLLGGIEQVFFVGRGPSLAACGTGGLITKEAARVHAEGMSSAALRHGPLEMLNSDCFVLVFAGERRTRALNQRLYRDLCAAGIPAGWAEMGSGGGPFDLPVVPNHLLPLAEILPVEMMTLALARLRGRVAGAFERAAKVTTTE